MTDFPGIIRIKALIRLLFLVSININNWLPLWSQNLIFSPTVLATPLSSVLSKHHAVCNNLNSSLFFSSMASHLVWLMPWKEIPQGNQRMRENNRNLISSLELFFNDMKLEEEDWKLMLVQHGMRMRFCLAEASVLIEI